jgi:hypothetical protein
MFSPHTWKPRLPAAEQCASCPFRGGNDAEFGTIVAKLLGKKKATKAQIKRARESVQHDVLVNMRPDFACHASAYRADMSVRPLNEHKQCPEATQAFQTCAAMLGVKNADR